MKIHQLTEEQAYTSLRSNPNGLSEQEAHRRLLEYGANRVEEVEEKRLLPSFIQEFTHFFALILWLAAILAFIAEWNEPGQGMAMLGYAIIGVIIINGLFSFWQEYRAQAAVAALRNLLPHQVKAMRDGTIRQIPAEGLVPGDVIHLTDGDIVPADCRLLEAFGVRVNNATITGESLSKACSTGRSSEDEAQNSHNVLLAGTIMVSGEAKALVYATGMHSEFGKIAHLTQIAGTTLSPLQLEIKRLSHLIAMLSVCFGAVFFLLGLWLGLPFWTNLIFAIGIIVANVPEGLLPTVTLALAMATQRMAKKNALVRHLPAVETLGSTTVICTDKTGTLTQNRMTVKQLFLSGEFCLPVEVDRLRNHPLLAVARYCHNLKQGEIEGKQTLLGDPMEIALFELAQTAMTAYPDHTQIAEIPFDTDRKRLSLVYRTAEDDKLYCKGALETVLPLCHDIYLEGTTQPLDEAQRQQLLDAQEYMAEQGLRVLALAFRCCPPKTELEHLEEKLTLCGLVGIEDPPRVEVPAAIAQCRSAGIKVIMVTGDHPHTARAIAREIGLAQNPLIIEGDELRHLSQIQLQLALDAEEIIFARVGADQKMRIVQALKKKGEIVAVTGDGVNDAPALKAADIGISMGISGTDVAKESADIILLDDNFAHIVSAIEEGRTVFENIRKFMTYILTHITPELVPYLAFALFKIPLPLPIVQILAVDLGTDILPALALGAEAPCSDVMQKPPRARNERLLHWPLLGRAYLFLGVMEAIAAMAMFFYVLNNGGWQYGQVLSADHPLYLQATTACLSTIIVMQVMNVFICRHPTESAFRFAWFGNRLLLLGVAVEISLILLIVYTPWGNNLFGTAPISIDVWLYAIPFGLAMLMLEELRKALLRYFNKQNR
ncbi:cation-transporting P-type ATPase [Nitrosomonas sp. Is37]|uniref:cation-translocating P-type ATPase n=1 Tax=Nitrosomonas sp. Is37 TaxID=3080535 RepID=UPI00294AF826|nr:cation-transporting P-type ATPase [Nitrosomonas sp. Is37]MDV6344049.1 cation-transporting P-type ATPase [Nitrosomonas sp. Is37]